MKKEIQDIFKETKSSLDRYCTDLEIYSKISRSSMIHFNDHRISQSSLSFEDGVAVRCWDKNGFEYFHHFSRPGDGIHKIMQKIIQKIDTNDKIGARFPSLLPSKRENSNEIMIFCSETAETSQKGREDFIHQLISSSQEGKGGARLVNGQLMTSVSEHFLMNSRGFEGSYKRTIAFLSLSCEQGLGRVHDASFSFASHSFLELDFASISRELFFYPADFRAEKAKLRKELHENQCQVLLSPRAASEVLRFFAPYLVRTTDAVFSERLTIIDDPTMKKGLNSAPFDGAGFPVQRRMLVDKGHFVDSFRCLVRVSYTDRPAFGATNTYVNPSNEAPEDIMQMMGRGLYVTSVRPFFSLSPSGVFLALGGGFIVEHGRIIPAYNQLFLSENILDIFRDIIWVGNDLRFSYGGGCFGSPSLLIGKMNIASASS